MALRMNPDTARTGMKWTNDEDTELMERAISGMDIQNIARVHKRTVGGVQSRVMLNALTMMEKMNKTLEEVSQYVHVPVEYLEAFKQNKMKKAHNNTNISEENETVKSGSKTWSKDEEKQLLEEIQTLHVQEIATLHKRTSSAINLRLRHIGCRLVEKGEAIGDVGKRLRISEEKLLKSMDMRAPKSLVEHTSPEDTYMSILQEIRDLLKLIAEK